MQHHPIHRRGRQLLGVFMGLALTLSVGAADGAATEESASADGDDVAIEEAPGAVADAELERFTGAAEVVGSRLSGDALLVGRREVVLTREEIEALPVQSVQELLAMLPGVGLARRGARGVQADLNLRGANFEQVLVLVNGMRVNNPQTGHLHLDVFIPVAAIERVEVLYGAGSAAYGPDAFGGAINIVTGVAAPSAYLRAGENHLSGGGVAWELPASLWVAAEREVHSGFRDNTEADVNQAAGGWSWRRGDAHVNLAVAAGRRRFGAHAFYSQAYPDEREATSGQLLTLGAAMPAGPLQLGVGLRLDHHADDFILDRNRPEWYRNRHRTQGALVDLTLSSELAGWRWLLGVEMARDEIDSSNLGRHHRARGAAFAELGRFADDLSYAAQLRVDHQDPWGWVSTVAVGGSWQPVPGWRLRGHVGESFRAPSFTDLYYSSPATVGNPELAPEEGRSVELGADHGPWSVSLFERRADPVIDYLLDDDGVWRAANLGSLRTRGVELALYLPAAGPLRWQRLGLMLLDSELDVDPLRSRYALAHPDAEASWSGALELADAWRAGWALRWRDPGAEGSWSTLDLSVERRLGRGFGVALEGSNILDREITELAGVPLPGRWLSVSVTWREEER